MKKVISVFVLIVVLTFVGVYIYENYEGIVAYLTNKEWEITESIGKISLSNAYAVDGTDSNLVVVGGNYIKGYGDNLEENFDIGVSLKEAIIDSAGDFCIIGENGGTKAYMINDGEKVWENDIQGTILGVSINKNGYAAIIYKQTGYKSLVKVVSAEGKELFTNYLASTYIFDAEISNDNKFLALAEIDADGTKIQSNVKLIDISNVPNSDVNKIELEEGELIIDVEYNNDNDLNVYTDKGAKLIVSSGEMDNIEIFGKDVLMATIEGGNYLVTVEVMQDGLFNKTYLMNVYDCCANEVSKAELVLNNLPTKITVNDKKIALLTEGELLVVNANAKIIKRCEIDGNAQSVVFFGNNLVGIIFRDKVDVVKI